jgi:hypothetical protein
MTHRSSLQKLLWAGSLCFALAPAAAEAQLCTVISGGANYTIPAASHYDTTPTSNFTGVGTGDYVFEDGWWFRVAGDAQEFVFPAPNSTVCAAAAGTITWTDVASRGLFSAVNTLAITSAGAGQGELKLTMSITNLSTQGNLVLALFHGVDFDVNGTAGTDNTTLVTPNTHMNIADTTAGAAQYRAFDPDANAFLCKAFGAADVFAELGDANVDNFDNTTMPLPSADMTGAYQWNLDIPPGGTQSVSVSLAGNTVSTPVELQGFAVE